jgi:hypothetical protein
VIVDVVHEEKYWYPTDGGIVWVAGYHPVDAAGRFLGRDAPELAERGIVVTGAAGAGRHHADALQSEAAAPGEPLVLRRDAGNAHDANAIAVETAAGDQVGWVPRDLAIDVAADLDAGRPWSALVLREQRASPRDPRTGITMLLAPAAELSLRPVTRR